MTDLDFIPPEYHAAAKQRHSSHAQVLWGAALGATMLAWMWMHRVEVARAEEQLQAVRVEQDQLGARRRFFDALVAERMRLQARGAVQAAVNDRASWVVALAELSTLLPEGALLLEISIEDAGVPTSAEVIPAAPGGAAARVGASVAPANVAARWPRLRLVGAAPSNVLVSTFTARLGGSALFRDVQTGLVKDVVMAGRRVRQFEVQCTVVPQTGGPR